MYPSIKAIGEAEEKIEEQQELKTINDQKLSVLPILETDNAELEEEILSSREEFYPMMSSGEIDKLFTGLVLGYNLEAYQLDIKMPDDIASLSPYQFSEKMLNPVVEEEEEDSLISIQTQADSVDKYADDEDEEEEEDIPEEEALIGIYMAEVGMRLGGDEYDLLRLINDLSGVDNKLQVASYSWSEDSQIVLGADGDYGINKRKVLNLNLHIYMCEE